MEYIKIFVDLFAAGKSDMKVYFFAIFLIICLLIKKFSKKINFNNKFIKIKKVIILLTITLLIINIGSFLYFFKSNNINLLSNVYVYNNNEVSSTNILHNHTLKAPVAFLLDKFNIDPIQEHVDTGYAFTNFFSPIFMYLVLILVLILIYFIIIYIYSYNKNQNFLQTFIFIILSFSILKNIFDGGIFNVETILALSLILIILKNESIFNFKEQKRNLIFFIIYTCFGLIIAFVSGYNLPLSRSAFVYEYISKLLFFLSTGILYYRNQLNKDLILVYLAPIIILIGFKFMIYGILNHKNNLVKISPSDQIITFTNTPTSNKLEIISEIKLNDKSVLTVKTKDVLYAKDLKQILAIKEGFDYLGIKDVNCNIIENGNIYRSFDTRLDEKEFLLENNMFTINKTNGKLNIKESSCLIINPSLLKSILDFNSVRRLIIIQSNELIL